MRVFLHPLSPLSTHVFPTPVVECFLPIFIDETKHRNLFYILNQASKAVFGSSPHATLEPSYYMKTLHLRNVEAAAKVYMSDIKPRTEPTMLTSLEVGLEKCSAAFIDWTLRHTILLLYGRIIC